jgi:hypothetical protein
MKPTPLLPTEPMAGLVLGCDDCCGHVEGDRDVPDPSGIRQNRSVNLGFGSSFQP